jgi:hypothetical protein
MTTTNGSLRWLASSATAAAAGVSASDSNNSNSSDSPIYSFELERIDGTKTTLAEFKNDVILVVNLASA